MSNPFDQFDQAAPAASANPFDQFDAAPSAPPAAAAPVAGDLRGPAAMRNHLLAPTEVSALVAGKDRALNDLVDRPAQALASVFGQGDQVGAENQSGRQAYDAQYASQPAAQFGRMAGQAALTIPVMGALGRVASAGGEALAAGAGTVSPTAGGAIQNATNFLAGEAGGAGGVIPRLTQGASALTNQGLQGATAAALTAGQSDASLGSQIGEGALTGAIVGGGIQGAGAAASGVRNAVVGNGVAPALADLARTARDKYGIMLTADMITDSPFLKTVGSQASQIPLTGMAESKASLRSQFMKGVTRTLGEEGDQITPGVMERAATRIGGVMDDVAARSKVVGDQTFLDGLAAVDHEASFLTPDQQGVIGKHIDNVMGSFKDGQSLTGEQYQSLTKFNSPLGKATRSSDSDVREAAINIRHHIDDALERSIPEGSSLLDQLREARSQYKNLKTIEPLVTKGEPGEITPELLRGVVDRSYKGRAMREAQPALGELADIGQRFNLGPDSRTAGRGAALAAMTALGSAGTQLVTGNMTNALLTAGALPAAMAGGRMATSYLTNPAVINRMLAPAVPAAAPAATNSLLQYAAPASEILRRNALSQ